jgi:hypothetical protein
MGFPREWLFALPCLPTNQAFSMPFSDSLVIQRIVSLMFFADARFVRKADTQTMQNRGLVLP